MSSLVFDSDDFGVNHVISDQCQSHDCRDVLDKLHFANPGFKATLFAIPGEVTFELLEWCRANNEWIELAWHGFYHKDNWECSKMTYEEFDANMQKFKPFEDYFIHGFKAPGWQIGDDVYRWLKDNEFWVADKGYNNDRRPEELPAYVNYDGNEMRIRDIEIPAYHGHTWDVGPLGNAPNGIYEDFDNIKTLVNRTDSFKFISEAISENF